MEENNISICYSFVDNSHSMDAFVFTNCQWEVAKLIQELAESLDVKIKIEVSSIEEGSVIQKIKLLFNSETKTVGASIILSALTACLITPIGELLTKDSELEELNKENIEADINLKKAQTKKIETEIRILEVEEKKLNEQKDEVVKAIDSIKDKVDTNTKVIKRISNFYESASKEPKITSITINNNINQHIIKRDDFEKHILISDNLEPKIIEDAVIEIVSPVLKKGSYKWRGIYNGEQISFYMKSNEFKTKVQVGDIVFKNGDCIKGELEIERKIDNSGEIKIISYSINQVDEYITNGSAIATDEGLKNRRKKQANMAQLDLFSNIEDDTE